MVELHRSGGSFNELADEHGIRVGCKRVARLMRAAGLRGVMPKRYVTTTMRAEGEALSDDLVQRQFKADGPDQLWVADITYIPTWAGFLYLAIVLDVWSRKIVGWCIKSYLGTEVVLTALSTALAQRRPKAVVHYSDHGCQYTSYAFGKGCQEMGVMPSMGSIGIGSNRRPKPGSRSSSGSKAGTTCIGVTRRSGVSHPSTSKGDS